MKQPYKLLTLALLLCSVAMASGSDAAKNVSSLVLLDSNFASMPKVVEEGRRSINNLERTASLYLMKTLYNTMLAVLFMIIPMGLPFEPRNLTVISSVTIGMPSIALALEPNKERVSGHFLPKVLSHALPGSLTVVIGAIAVMITSNFILKDMTTEQVQGMYIVLTTFVGLMYLFKVVGLVVLYPVVFENGVLNRCSNCTCFSK